MKLAKRHGFESSLKDPSSLINISGQEEMDFKIASMKAKMARRNNSMKS